MHDFGYHRASPLDQARRPGAEEGAAAPQEGGGTSPPACLALGATVHTTGRAPAAAEFSAGPGRTALEPGEIVTAVTFPVPAKAAYVKFLNPAARYAMAGVFVAL